MHRTVNSLLKACQAELYLIPNWKTIPKLAYSLWFTQDFYGDIVERNLWESSLSRGKGVNPLLMDLYI